MISNKFNTEMLFKLEPSCDLIIIHNGKMIIIFANVDNEYEIEEKHKIKEVKKIKRAINNALFSDNTICNICIDKMKTGFGYSCTSCAGCYICFKCYKSYLSKQGKYDEEKNEITVNCPICKDKFTKKYNLIRITTRTIINIFFYFELYIFKSCCWISFFHI